MTIEWVIYFIIEIAFVVFFVMSCYNADILYRFNNENIDLRHGLDIAIEFSIVIIGIFILYIWNVGKITDLQICFCSHIAPFLIITGITAIISTSKRIKIK